MAELKTMNASDFHPRRQTLRILAAIQILFAASVTARASDVAFYLVAKGHQYSQTSTAPPALKSSPYRFSTLVGIASTNSVTNATVQALPSGQVIPLALQTSGTIGTSAEFSFNAKYATNTDLEAAFPNGNYQLVIQAAHDGTKTSTLPLNGDAYPATVPFLNNFTAAQAINSSNKYTLSWAAFTGGTTNDIILVTISDVTGHTIFSSPDPGQPGCLNGTNTSFVIPPNTLPSGSFLGGSLIFAKVVKRDTTSYAGVPGFALYYTQTQINLATAAGAATPPRLSVISTNTPGQFQILLTGQAGSRYAIDGSTNLQPAVWVPLFTNTATGGQFIFTDSQFAGFPHRFYRGRSAN